MRYEGRGVKWPRPLFNTIKEHETGQLVHARSPGNSCCCEKVEQGFSFFHISFFKSIDAGMPRLYNVGVSEFPNAMVERFSGYEKGNGDTLAFSFESSLCRGFDPKIYG